MTCPRCGKETWDNRTKKMDDPQWKNAADFTCKDKACGWKSGQPASPVGATTPIAVPAVSQAPQNGSRDAQLVALYWTCFDEVLQGLKTRSMASGFPGSEIAACVATMFIARSKIL